MSYVVTLVKEVFKHKTFILNGRAEMPICEDAAGRTGLLLPGLSRHQVVSRIVFSKGFADILDLMCQKPGPETDSILGFMVNNTSP